MRSENRECGCRAGQEGGGAGASCQSLSVQVVDAKRGREREREAAHIVKPLCFSSRHQAMTDTRWCLPRSLVSHLVTGPVAVPASSSAIPLEGLEATTFGLPDVSAWFHFRGRLDVVRCMFGSKETERAQKRGV